MLTQENSPHVGTWEKTMSSGGYNQFSNSTTAYRSQKHEKMYKYGTTLTAVRIINYTESHDFCGLKQNYCLIFKANLQSI